MKTHAHVLKHVKTHVLKHVKAHVVKHVKACVLKHVKLDETELLSAKVNTAPSLYCIVIVIVSPVKSNSISNP